MKNDYARQIFYDRARASGKHWSKEFYKQVNNDGYKYAFRPYRPGFVGGFDKDEELVATNSFKDYLKIPFYRNWEGEHSFSEYGDEYIIKSKEYVIGFVNNIQGTK